MATLTTPPVGGPETDHAPMAVGEPSMEDILASIRRIIAEDQTNNLGRTGFGSLSRAGRRPDGEPPAAATPEAQPDHTPIATDEALATGPAFDPADHQEGAMSSETMEIHRPDEPALVDAPPAVPEHPDPLHDRFIAAELTVPHPEPERSVEDQPLLSASTGASVTSSFHALAESMLLQDKALVERLTRDELRPLLKTWLDDNLPGIVERLVRTEIERVARGGRG